jgi:OH-DDVA oxygenase/3-O-methylgallate 3,4-dioxygenase
MVQWGSIMAEIVLGIWTTHGPQLSTTPEQWMLRVPIDRSRKHWYKGSLYPFEVLSEMRRGENLVERSSLESRTRSHAACQKAIARVAEIWKQVSPDVCVVFGNDQRELVLPEMQPAYTVYCGKSFWNGPLSEERAATLPAGIVEAEWANRPKERTEYPGLPDLAALLIERGLDKGWDFAAHASFSSSPCRDAPCLCVPSAACHGGSRSPHVADHHEHLLPAESTTALALLRDG